MLFFVKKKRFLFPGLVFKSNLKHKDLADSLGLLTLLHRFHFGLLDSIWLAGHVKSATADKLTALKPVEALSTCISGGPCSLQQPKME